MKEQTEVRKNDILLGPLERRLCNGSREYARLIDPHTHNHRIWGPC